MNSKIFVCLAGLSASVSTMALAFDGPAKIAECESERGHNSTKIVFTAIVAKDKIVALDGQLSWHTVGTGDFLHGSSTLTGKVTGMTRSEETIASFTIAGGKEVLNTDGQVSTQDFNKVSLTRTPDNGATALFVTNGSKNSYEVKNCVFSNASVIANNKP